MMSVAARASFARKGSVRGSKLNLRNVQEVLDRMMSEKLLEFLQRHGFHSPTEPRSLGRVRTRMEAIYPIHVAAQNGNALIVDMLIRCGADPGATLHGQTALDFALEALEANLESDSHKTVLLLLEDAVMMRTECL